MKSARAMLLLAAIVFVSNAHAQAPADPDQMRRCTSFDQCMLVWGGCGDTAINKMYANQFKPSGVCAASSPHNPNAVPTCADGLCVAVAPDRQK